MEIKPHDWFATLMYQPDLRIERMHDLGIMPSTASMKSRDEYKNIKAVLENPAFQNEDGGFDEKKFDNFYDSALLAYNNAAELEYLDKIESSYEYDPWAWYAAGKKQRVTEPVALINPNPWRMEYGIDGLGNINPGKFSAREIAQDQYYYDSEKGEFSDKKPNDFVGIFKSFKAPRLVLDTYDEDTIEVENGKEVLHEKGSFKLNPYGAPYYRTLRDDEEIYDKDLLHVTDIWSTDGVGINKYDPFDSDGLTTEPWKVVTKNILRVAPFLIGGEVGLVIKGLSAAAALFEFMPTFLKAVDGIATNNAMDNDFGRKMNQLESWLGRLDNSVSDRSREKLVTFENIGNMFADVTAQLFQQKAVARLPQSKLFKNVSWMYNNPKVGRALSYAYMSATSSKEAYSIFKNAGANDTTAGIAMLSLMGVYYGLMSSDYFKDVLFKGTWLDESQYKRITWNVLQDFKNATLEKEVPAITSPETAKQALNWFQKAWTKAIGTIPVEGKGFALGALSEGVEETMEEVGIDALKGLAAGMNALGIPVTVENRDLDFGYSWDDVKTRYLTSFFGGAFGGAVFHGYNLMDPAYRKSLTTARQLAETPDGRIAELVNLATQGRLNDVKKYATRLAEKGLVGNDSLSGTLFETIDSVEGKTDVAASSDKSISQNQLVYDTFMKQVNFIESVLSDEGFLDARNKIANALKLDKKTAGVQLFQSLGVNDLVMYDVRRLGTEIVKIRAKMQTIADSLRPNDDNYDKTEYEKTVKNNSEYKQYEEQLKDLRKQFDELLNAENISRYVAPAVLVRNNTILKALLGYSNIDEYVQAMYYGKHLEDFTPAQQEIIQYEFEKYKSGEKKHVFELSEIYRTLGELMAKDLVELDKKYTSLEDDADVDITTYGNQYISYVLQKSKLYAEHSKLNAKENKTDEDLTKLAKLSKDLADLDKTISDFKSNPYLATHQVENAPIDYVSITDGAKELLEHYKSLAGKFKYSDGELDEFFYKVRKHWLNLNIRAITEEWLYNQDVDDDNSNSFYRQTEETPIRKEFYNLLSRFYSQLWVDNEGARRTYDAIVDLLKNRVGMSDDMIKSLLNNQIATGETETVTNDDGTTKIIRLTDSLIPQIEDTQSILDYITELNDARSKIIYSDLSEILTKFSVATEDGELIDMIKALQDEEFKIIGNLEDYRIGDPLIQSKLEKAQLFLKAIFAEVAGAGTGANKIINIYRKNESKEPLAEISDSTRSKVLKQLNMLSNRIQFVMDLHALNAGQKMRQQQDIGINMRVKFLQNFKEKVYVEEFKKEFFDPTEILEELDLDNITIENFEQNESKIIEAESKLYDKMQELNLSEEELAKKLVTVFGKNSAWRQRTTKFTADKKLGVTDYDQIVYAASVFSLHSGAFFYKERTLLEELQNAGEVELIPVFPQEHALRIIYSFIHNQRLFNALISEVNKSYNGEDSYVINRILLNNMISVFGGAGTGKTRGVGFFLSKFFDNVEFLFVGPTQNQVNNLLKVFNGKTEQGKTFEQFFSTVAPQYLQSSNFSYDSVKQTVVAKDISLNFKDWWSTENDKVRILLVDEAGLANSHQLDVFSRYADHFGAFVVTLGDTKQTTSTISWETEKKKADGTTEIIVSTEPDGFEETVGIRTPPLKATFRAENRAKADNYSKLDQRIETIDDKIQSSETPIEASKRDKLVEKIDTVLDYYIYDDHISGDYITNKEDEFKSLLDKLMQNESNRILLIVDSESAKKYQDPKYDKITKQDARHAQGGEYHYVFVDKTISDSKYDNLKDLYTTSQRATLASVVLDSDKIYDDSLGIKVHERKDSDLSYVIPNDERNRFITWRINALKHIEKPDDYDELIAIPLNTKVVPSSTKKKTYVTPQTEVTVKEVEKSEKEEKTVPEVQNIPTPEAIVKKEEKAETEESTKPKVNDSEKSKVIPLIDSTKPIEKFVDNTPVEEVKEQYDDFDEETPRNKVSTWADSNNFFDLIFSQAFKTFFDSETSNPNSLWSLVKNNGLELTSDEYRNILLMLHKAVMSNVSIKDAIAQSKLKIRGDRLRKFKSIFQDENLIYSLWNINSDGKSNLTLVITNQIDTKFQHTVIVGTLNGIIMPTGRFSDDTRFSILTKPNYKRNDTEWVTIAQLKERFPWLDVYSIGGIPINSDIKQRSSDYDEATKEFLVNKDGNLLGFASDLDVDERLLLETGRKANGTLYLHNYSDRVRTFGIQRRVSPKEIITYAACIYYLNNKGYSVGGKSETVLNALIELGVVSNNSRTPLDDVCKYLQTTTKNIGWYELVGLANDKTTDGARLYYEKLRKCCIESPVITSGITERISTDLLSGVLNENSELSGLAITNLYYEFTKKAFTKNNVLQSKRAALILNAMDRHYIIKSRQDGTNWKLELYRCEPNDNSYTIIGSAIASYDLKAATFNDTLKRLILKFGEQVGGMQLNQFNSYNVAMQIRTEEIKGNDVMGYYFQNPAAMLYSLFGFSFIKNSNFEKSLNPNRFKYGINGAIVKSETARGDQMARANVTDDLVTNASHWTASTYSFTGTIVSGTLEDPNTANRTILYNQATYWLDEVRYNVGEKISDFEQLASDLMNTIKNDENLNDDSLELYFNEFLNNINQRLLEKTLDLYVTQFNLEDGMIVKTTLSENNDSSNLIKTYAYNNIIKTFDGINDDSTNEIIFSHNGIDVVKNSDRTFVIYKTVEGVLQAIETKTYDNWKSAWDYLNSLPITSSERIIPYLFNLLTNSVTESQVNDYLNANPPEIENINKFINNYLEQRLINEEC